MPGYVDDDGTVLGNAVVGTDSTGEGIADAEVDKVCRAVSFSIAQDEKRIEVMEIRRRAIEEQRQEIHKTIATDIVRFLVQLSLYAFVWPLRLPTIVLGSSTITLRFRFLLSITYTV